MTYQQQKQQVLSLFKTALTLAQKHGTDTNEQNLREAADYLAQGKLFVVVCGEFSRGKSSLINVLLNDLNLLPVDIDVTTNLVSTIAYGQGKFIVLLGEHGNEETKEIQRQEIASYVTEKRNKGNVKQAKLLSIEIPNEQLKEGLILADTPGVGSLNKEHTSISYALIPSADAILFVSDASAPLTTEELKFIETIKLHCQTFIFAVTKIDKNPNYQAIVEENRNKLTPILEKPREQISIIPVSNELKKTYLMYNESEDLEESNFPVLEKQLWQLLNQQRGYILIMNALKKLSQQVFELRRPLQAQWEAYRGKSQEEKAQMEQQLKEAKENLRRLSDNQASWRTQIGDGMADIKSELMMTLQENFRQVRRSCEDWLEDNKLRENPAEIVSLLENEIDSRMVSLGERLNTLAAELHSQIEASTGLSFNPFETSPLEWPKPEFKAQQNQPQSEGLWEKTLTVGSRAAISSSAAGFLLGVGWIIPGVNLLMPVIAPVAVIAAASTGAKQALTQMKEKDKLSVLRLLREYLEESQQACKVTLTENIVNLERHLRDEFTQRINQERENCEEALQAVAKANKLSQAEASQRAAALKAPLDQLNQLLNEIEKLSKSVVDQHESAPIEEQSQPNPPAVLATSAATDSNYGAFADE